MALTVEEVCNLALLRVGERQTIESINEDNAQAKACKALLAPCRDELLEACWWNFATRRATLAALSETARSGWSYVYALPADCIAARYIYAGMRTPPATDREAFVIELNEKGTNKVLLTDKATPELVYTYRVGTVALWSPGFVQAVAWRLAVDLAGCLPVKPGVAAAIEPKAAAALRWAMALNKQEAQEDPEPDASLIRARE